MKHGLLHKVFENRILKRIFVPKVDENEDRRRFHNDKLHSLYLSSNIARTIRSRRLRWAVHIARMDENRSALKIVNLHERFRSSHGFEDKN